MKNPSVLFLCLAAALTMGGSASGADTLATILGSATNEWQIRQYSGAANDYTLTEEGGRPILVAGSNATILACLTKIPVDSEVTVRLRLGAAGEKATTVYFSAGLKSPDENGYGKPLFLMMSVAAGAEQESVICQMPALPGQAQGVYSPYTVRSLPKDRLTWPAMTRARVEEEYASAPSLGKRWLTLRYVARRDAAQLYLDGRLLRDAKGPGVDPEGYFSLSVYEGAQVASVRFGKLPPEDPVFEPVQVAQSLNASRIAGAQVQRDSLPGAGRGPAVVANVPFDFPAPDEQGNDHIALNSSWLRCGLLEGAFDGWEGETARWLGAMSRNPGRICFRVRKGPYSRLHLLAAFDDERDTVPVVTAQFYRNGDGHPVNFRANVPSLKATASEAHPVPVKLVGGGKGKLWLVTIPLEPEGLASFSDLDHLEFELTKEPRIHRSFPDPGFYSSHGAGLPSGVHVYAITLERPAVEVDLQPDKFAHIWTAPDKPAYTVTLKSHAAEKCTVDLKFFTESHDGTDKTTQARTVELAAGGTESVKLPLDLKRYGHHRVELQVKDGQGIHTQTRGLAWLHPDTRERGNWEEGRGPLFGFWDWNGSHLTPTGIPRLEVAVAAGAESVNRPLIGGPGYFPPEELAYAEAHNLVTHFLAYAIAPSSKEFLGMDFDPSKPEEMKAAVVAALKKSPMGQGTKLNKPEAAVFFGEPIVGPVTYMSFPEYYGEPPYVMTADEQKAFKGYNDQFVIAASAIKKEWPNAKCYMPWGISSFPIAFLRNSKEATELMDGPAVDHILFERLPEMQMHQVTFASVFWQLKQEWIKAGKPWPPRLMSVEGGGLASPAMPGALTTAEEAEHMVRGELLLFPYGVTRHLGWPSPFACAGAWGESHYGSGLCEGLPLLSPKVAYAAYATMTRQLNRMNYVKAIETGSASVFCLQFKHYQTGALLHVLWTLRGTRPVSLAASPGTNQASPITVCDSMDNEAVVPPKDGKAELIVGTAPCYVRGLMSDAIISLGEADHSDSQPGKVAQRLSNLGGGEWKISDERDNDYENSNLVFIRKFPGKMQAQPGVAPSAVGGKALAVHLEKQDKERKVMPYYTTLVPKKPIRIPGKSSHMGLWVHAASDWGRFVYCLRDAKGERWISVGKKDEWNADDMHCWSAFNFDGWCYLRFEMPANAPWDCFREMGTTYWGYYGQGDGIVDLPLTLEKVIVERRTHVIKVDELIPANPEDVWLADLNAEYETEADKTEEAVRLSRLRMPKPKDAPTLENPIAKLAATGVGQPTKLVQVKPPEHEYDGTRCLVFFETVPGAKSYDIWVSPYSDGRGAIILGPAWTESGKLLTGLPASVELFLFVTYTDKDGKTSKPSAAKRILLKDDFPFK